MMSEPISMKPDPMLTTLRRLTGLPDAEFREGQKEAIEILVQGRQSVVCVQRTGWGKSAVYFVATHLMRERGAGPTVIISPLLALMRNQLVAAQRLGIRAETINSSNQDEWERVVADLEANRLDLLLISPERLANRDFMATIEPIVGTIGLFVVDEAHCISDWGHDFRPDYRRLREFISRLPEHASVLCTTATANNRVVADIEEQLGESNRLVTELRGSLDRESLRLEVLDIPTKEEKLAWLITHLANLDGSGIIYCSTINDVEQVAGWLRRFGFSVEKYHGGMDNEARLEVEASFTGNELKAVVATTALSMGYDKPDLGFVIHFQSPGSAVAYYQQVGRAGRALDHADAVLLRSEADFDIQNFFISTSIPPRERVEQLFNAFASHEEPVSIRELQAQMNLGQRRIGDMLTMLEVEGAVERVRGWTWEMVDASWPYDDVRFNRLSEIRSFELERMREYGTDGTCLMSFLRKELDDEDDLPCGRCSICTGNRFADFGSEEILGEARKFLRDRVYKIKPRKMWAGRRSGSIPADRRMEPGLAISKYADGAFGDLVRAGKYEHDEFSDELVQLSVRRLNEWDPDPPVTWVTAVPSLKHPELVPTFARKLATSLGVPFIPAVTRSRAARPQKEMNNSYQQATNVFEAFAVDAAQVIPGAVLLVDDMCDSRWTMTEIAFLLLGAGSGPVFPFALSDSSNR